MAFLLRAGREGMIFLAIELGEEVSPTINLLLLKKIIEGSKLYDAKRVEDLTISIINERKEREEAERRLREAEWNHGYAERKWNRLSAKTEAEMKFEGVKEAWEEARKEWEVAGERLKTAREEVEKRKYEFEMQKEKRLERGKELKLLKEKEEKEEKLLKEIEEKEEKLLKEKEEKEEKLLKEKEEKEEKLLKEKEEKEEKLLKEKEEKEEKLLKEKKEKEEKLLKEKEEKEELWKKKENLRKEKEEKLLKEKEEKLRKEKEEKLRKVKLEAEAQKRREEMTFEFEKLRIEKGIIPDNSTEVHPPRRKIELHHLMQKFDTQEVENIWVSQAVVKTPMCLPLAEVELQGKFGHVITKAVVTCNPSDNELYLLENGTEDDVPHQVSTTETHAQIPKTQQVEEKREAEEKKEEVISSDLEFLDFKDASDEEIKEIQAILKDSGRNGCMQLPWEIELTENSVEAFSEIEDADETDPSTIPKDSNGLGIVTGHALHFVAGKTNLCLPVTPHSHQGDQTLVTQPITVGPYRNASHIVSRTIPYLLSYFHMGVPLFACPQLRTREASPYGQFGPMVTSGRNKFVGQIKNELKQKNKVTAKRQFHRHKKKKLSNSKYAGDLEFKALILS